MEHIDARPLVIPDGWASREVAGITLLYKESRTGLRATFTHERYRDDQPDAPLGLGGGTFAHIVISRVDRYPGWNEMRDFIRTCGLFDRQRDIFMILPPDVEYLTLHKNAFHWYQKQ